MKPAEQDDLFVELLQRMSALEREVKELRREKAVLYGDKVHIGYITDNGFNLIVQGFIDRKSDRLRVEARNG